MKRIQFSYRKIIDAQSHSLWERYVFDDTYSEFLMQVQLYDPAGKYQALSTLLAANPKAEKLHFLVSPAATGYINQLGNKIPDIKNTSGKTFLPFHSYRFEIIDSHLRNKKEHRVAICFYSDPILWLDTIGNSLLVSLITEDTNNSDTIQTDLVKLQPFMSIHSIQLINHASPVFSENILS
jgi:hypothetical protein